MLNTVRRPWGPRWTPTSTCCSRPRMSRPTIFCPSGRTTPRVESQTPRSSRCAWPRRSWASRLTGDSWRSPPSAWGICSPSCPNSRGYFKRRRRLADTLEWRMGIFASQSPGFQDDLLLIDSTPIECARSRETVKRSALRRHRWVATGGQCGSRDRWMRARVPVMLGRHVSCRLVPRCVLVLAALVALAAVMRVGSLAEGVLYLAPALLVAVVLVARRYPGERLLARWARRGPRRRPTAVPRCLTPGRVGLAALPRGGLLMAFALAVRPPPAVALS